MPGRFNTRENEDAEPRGVVCAACEVRESLATGKHDGFVLGLWALPCQWLRLSCSITPNIWLKGRLIQGQMNTFSILPIGLVSLPTGKNEVVTNVLRCWKG